MKTPPCTCCHCEHERRKKARELARLESWLKAVVEGERERQSRPTLLARLRAAIGL